MARLPGVLTYLVALGFSGLASAQFVPCVSRPGCESAKWAQILALARASFGV